MVRFSDVSLVIIIIARDTTIHFCPSTQKRTDATAQTKSRLCACISALHTQTLRQTPLGVMIMKEIQFGTVGAVSVAQRL